MEILFFGIDSKFVNGKIWFPISLSGVFSNNSRNFPLICYISISFILYFIFLKHQATIPRFWMVHMGRFASPHYEKTYSYIQERCAIKVKKLIL